jgi:uncharacterized membrane protein
MSLLDTIKGARAEAEEAQGARAGKTNAAAGEAEAPSTKSSYARKSAANAKPTRELAGSVRSEKKAESQMTKEERKAAREKRRNEEDLRHEVAENLLTEEPGYKLSQRIWWVCVIAGMVCAFGAWFIMRAIDGNTPAGEKKAIVSIVLMVLAYLLVIGAFIFDLVKVRPMRNRASEKVTGMSKKRLKRMAESQEKESSK